jgi:hypothetical protein
MPIPNTLQRNKQLTGLDPPGIVPGSQKLNIRTFRINAAAAPLRRLPQ